ncbi:MAG: UPF0182 family membrane protein [Methermicoccaceae archaeon]
MLPRASNPNLYLRAVPIIILALIVIMIPLGSKIWLEYQWFVSVGYASVFLVEFYTKLILFVACSVLAFVILLITWHLNKRIILRTTKWVAPAIDEFYAPLHFPEEEEKIGPEVSTVIRSIAPYYLIGIVVLSLLIGFSMMNVWDILLKYINQSPFGTTDPIFGNDISFYIFDLPFFHAVLTYLAVVLLVAIISTALLFAFTNWRLVMDSQMVPIHLRLLYAAFAVVIAIKLYLFRYNILYSPTGVVYGAGYVDVHLLQYLPIIGAVIFIMSAAAALLTTFWKVPPEKETRFITRRSVLIPVLTVIAIVLVSFLGGIVATVVQSYEVSPNELELESQYIGYNIEGTNFAYGLNNISVHPYPAEGTLDASAVDSPSVRNARLWDYRPLYTTYQQKQAIRTYYGFPSLEIDRYNVDGKYTQVWLGVRELYQEQLGTTTWVNQHLLFTHGFGVVMSPVNAVESVEGGPVFYIQDIPPISTVGIDVTEPRIYYGVETNNYIVTNTFQQEFDYPFGDTNMHTTYAGVGGIPMTVLNKLSATISLGDMRIFLSDYIVGTSKLHIHRNVIDRVSTIAPYMVCDSEPHVFIDSEGRIKWMVHMFVVSDRYPYSEPVRGVNYIRDSVKAVVDAYNGTVEFYVINEDPILSAYMRIYPDVFKPYEEMPEDYSAHIRYSETLFSMQADIYRMYHMKNTVVFYNKEDRWAFPTEKFESNVQTVQPYNVILQLPGYDKKSLVMMIPFTPVDKNNMIAWMAVNQDPPSYGDLIVYNFPKDKLVFGPSQIEARIDQDESISQQLTLWDQAGSRVIRGNLLVIPINDSILYIEPLFLAAQEGSLPELKRVIAVYNNNVAMEDTLDKAVYTALGVSAPEEEKQKSSELNLNDLLLRLIGLYAEAKQKLSEGDIEGYGAVMKEVDRLLEEIQGRLGEASTPTTAASAAT